MPFGILALISKRSLSIHEGPVICASLTSYARAIRSRRVMLLSVIRSGFLVPPTARWPSVTGCDCLMDATSNAGGVPVWAANVYIETSAVVRMRILVLRRFLSRVDDQYVERRFAGIQHQAELLHGRKDRGRRSAGGTVYHGLNQSPLRIVAGSAAVARRIGTHAETRPIAATTAIAVAVLANPVPVPYSKRPRILPPTAIAVLPASRPAASNLTPYKIKTRRTSAGCAPRARRNPISRIRSLTENAITE